MSPFLSAVPSDCKVGSVAETIGPAMSVLSESATA